EAPLMLLKLAKEEGVRKVQMMSSMASQEFDPRQHDSDEHIDIRRRLQQNASPSMISMPDRQYGMQQAALESTANYYSHYRDLDVNVPRLAGVLNAHLPWPSDGTTEELDKLIVAAAIQKVYGDEWEEKPREVILERDGEHG